MPDELMRPRDEVLFQELEGEAILLDTATECCFRLNPLGTQVWALLCAGQDGRGIAREIAALYQIPLSQAETDIGAFLQRLEANGLLNPGNGEAAAAGN